MQIGEWFTPLSVLVAFLGVFIVGFTVFEWRKLRTLRRDLENIDARTDQRIHATLKATHRIIASYQISDIANRIALLEAAVADCPHAFNGFNALGFAYLEKGDIQKAIDAFTNATMRHPQDKAGYCDLAYAHILAGNRDLALKYAHKAIAVDASASHDIASDQRFAPIHAEI